MGDKDIISYHSRLIFAYLIFWFRRKGKVDHMVCINSWTSSSTTSHGVVSDDVDLSRTILAKLSFVTDANQDQTLFQGWLKEALKSWSLSTTGKFSSITSTMELILDTKKKEKIVINSQWCEAKASLGWNIRTASIIFHVNHRDLRNSQPSPRTWKHLVKPCDILFVKQRMSVLSGNGVVSGLIFIRE